MVKVKFDNLECFVAEQVSVLEDISSYLPWDLCLHYAEMVSDSVMALPLAAESFIANGGKIINVMTDEPDNDAYEVTAGIAQCFLKRMRRVNKLQTKFYSICPLMLFADEDDEMSEEEAEQRAMQLAAMPEDDHVHELVFKACSEIISHVTIWALNKEWLADERFVQMLEDELKLAAMYVTWIDPGYTEPIPSCESEEEMPSDMDERSLEVLANIEKLLREMGRIR